MKRLFVALLVLVILFSITCSMAEDYIITGNQVNFRSEPKQSKENIIMKLSAGDTVELLEYSLEWSKVSFGGQVGFISTQYLKKPSFGTAGIVTTGLNFRSEPNTESTVYSTIPKYSIVKILEPYDNKWYQIEYKDKVGYSYSSYISPVHFDDETLIGTFSTSFATGSSQKGRVYNIKKGAGLINEWVIKPGENFSLLQAIGPINKASGYKQAPEFKKTKNGSETVTGYGGGVCQIATTLYQSVCNAISSGYKITVTELHHHSKDVSYIKSGDDATISWNAKQDLSFRNDTIFTLKIRTYVKDGIISCMIYKCD